MTEMDKSVFPNEMRSIQDFQAFHQWLDEKNAFDQNIFFNMMLLSGEVGEVAQVLKKVHHMITPERNDNGNVKTLEEALTMQRENIGQELADCLAYIFKLANYTGVNLQEAYLKKMKENLERIWKYTDRQE